MSDIQRLCVYLGSNHGALPAYRTACDRLAEALVRRRIELVYGGGNVGLMGALADAVLARGGRAIGVIPRALVDKEVAHRGLTEQHVVASMHERKALMAELSGGFIALPGGIGTLEELFEVFTWAQLGFHRKPIGLLNVADYYSPLIRFLEHSVAQGFVREAHRNLVTVDTEVERLVDRLLSGSPPSGIEKWLDDPAEL